MNIVAAQRITLAHHIKGGMEVQADTLYRGLAARGHSVEVITTAHPTSLREVEDGRIRTHHLPRSDPRRYTAGWWNASYEKLRELVHRGRADILLSQSAGALPYIPRARRELNLPAVMLVHMSFGAGLQSQWRAARSLRGWLRLAYTLSQAPWHYLLWRKAVAAADAIIAVSDEVARDMRAEWRIEPAGRMVVVPNGIDVTRFVSTPEARVALRAELRLDSEQFVAIAAARLAHEKGVQVALKALARVPEATLVIAGDGPHASALQRQARDLEVAGRVRFLGFVPRDRLPGYLAAADAFVMPSLYREGLPVSILEAMACGLPVVASCIGGIPTAVTSETTGLLVHPGDDRDLAQALARLARDHELRVRLGVAARATAEGRFSVTRMVDDTLEVFDRVLAERSARP